MTEAGKIYCQNIDQAIMKGFNSDLIFDISQNMNSGSKFCEFNCRNWSLNLFNLIQFIFKKRKVKAKAVESWSFHSIDVFDKFSIVIFKEAGEDGRLIIKNVIKSFTKKFGEPVTQVLVNFKPKKP